MSRRTEIILFSVYTIIYVSTFALIGTGCINEIPFPITWKSDIVTVMPFEQWSKLVTTEKAILMHDPKYCKGKKLTVKYHGFLFEKRYMLSDGTGGLALYNLWWMGMLILDPNDGRFKKLGKGDWEIKVYTHTDINGNIVKEYNK